MELINLKGNTYVLDGINKIGIYLLNNEAIIIDTGLDETSGKEIIAVCKENKWQIKMVLITHAHPDHIGGASNIYNELKVPIYAYKTERIVCENPYLIADMAYGGFAHKFLKNKYLLPEEFTVLELKEDVLPKEIEMFSLAGHSRDMVGFKTIDDVYFLADAIAGADIINKYQLQFMYDVKGYFASLDYINNLNGIFVPSHGEICEDIKSLVDINRKVILEVIDNIKLICNDDKCFDEILQELTNIYHIKLEFVQYSFISVTLKCYLAYMLNEGMIMCEFMDNKLIWRKK